MTSPARRQCKATNRKGDPCGVHPLNAAGAAKLGLPEADQDYCRAHHPNLSDDDRFGSTIQSARAGASAKPRVPKLIEAMARMVEEEADEWMRVLRDARDAQRGVVVGNGPTASLEEIADHDVRLKAMFALLDRVAGKPRQALDVSGGEEPIRFEGDLTDPATRDLAHQLLVRMAGRAAD